MFSAGTAPVAHTLYATNWHNGDYRRREKEEKGNKPGMMKFHKASMPCVRATECHHIMYIV